MSAEWDAAGAGAAGGAASGAGGGALIGTAILPGPGTAIGAGVGAGVGALVGGASGYFGGRGASARDRAARRARNRYLRAVAKYQRESLAALAAERQRLAGLAERSQQNVSNRLANMGGDQSALLQSATDANMGALQTVQPALAGPLGDQYAAEFAGRTQTALQPMALLGGERTVAQSALDNDREYQLAQAALNPEYQGGEMMLNLNQAQRDVALNRARSQFGVKAGGGMAGSEQMMYGGMLSALANTGGQIGQQYAADARYESQRNQYYEDAASRNRGYESTGVLRPNQPNPLLQPYNPFPR